ncbi:hypothetical protein AB833_20490 [Chromatiales bacterium (ex Bugula neritina AB1)]|nr:hypothetical protein AB833_20490 [Chromatiales bacterium (ex Bugula neritina AB1)]
MIPITSDVPPFPLYRIFGKEDYRSSFLNGTLRFGWLGTYRLMESTDPRTDATEGTGRFETPVGDTRWVMGNSVLYILCFSKVRCNSHYKLLERKFKADDEPHGYGIEVFDPAGLTGAIQACLHSPASPFHELFDAIFWLPVKYTKGNVSNAQNVITANNAEAGTAVMPDDYPDPELQNQQKPRRFFAEREHRLCLRVRYPSDHPESKPLLLPDTEFQRRVEKKANVGPGQLGDALEFASQGVERWIDHIGLPLPDIRCFAHAVNGYRRPCYAS